MILLINKNSKNIFNVILTIYLTFFNLNVAKNQTVNIPDSVFKDFLINHNPVIDLNGDGKIQLNEATSYTGDLIYHKEPIDDTCIMECQYLYGFDSPEVYDCYQTCHVIDSSLFIRDLTGIKAFTNVKEIRFDNILLNRKPLEINNLAKLERLILDLYSNIGNYKVNIDISENHNLSEVYILQQETFDEITLDNIDLSNSSNLTFLHIGKNMGLDSIDLSTNTRLRRFNCNHNELSNIDLSYNTSLAYLEIYYNNLDSIDLKYNTGLLILHCSGNNFDKLDLSNNAALVFLTCSNNKLSSFNLKSNLNIVDVHCTDNNLSFLDFSYLPKFRSLKCSNNPNLEFINLKNGNNHNFRTLECDFMNLPALTHVCVDDENSDLVGFISSEIDHDAYFTEDCTSGTNEAISFKFSIYPNPANEYIKISSESNLIKKYIYNSNGQLILESGTETEVNISNFKDGLYHIRIIDENGNISSSSFIVE